MCECKTDLTQWGLNKMADILQTFWIAFSWKKNWVFWFKVIKIHLQMSNWQWVNTGSGIGLALNRLEAISCTNYDKVYETKWSH